MTILSLIGLGHVRHFKHTNQHIRPRLAYTQLKIIFEWNFSCINTQKTHLKKQIYMHMYYLLLYAAEISLETIYIYIYISVCVRERERERERVFRRWIFFKVYSMYKTRIWCLAFLFSIQQTRCHIFIVGSLKFFKVCVLWVKVLLAIFSQCQECGYSCFVECWIDSVFKEFFEWSCSSLCECLCVAKSIVINFK